MILNDIGYSGSAGQGRLCLLSRSLRRWPMEVLLVHGFSDHDATPYGQLDPDLRFLRATEEHYSSVSLVRMSCGLRVHEPGGLYS